MKFSRQRGCRSPDGAQRNPECLVARSRIALRFIQATINYVDQVLARLYSNLWHESRTSTGVSL